VTISSFIAVAQAFRIDSWFSVFWSAVVTQPQIAATLNEETFLASQKSINELSLRNYGSRVRSVLQV